MTEKICGDREYTVWRLREFFNSFGIKDDMPVRLVLNQWNFIKLYPKFSVKQLTSFGKPYVALSCREMDKDYNEIWEKWRDRGIENNKLRKENEQLKNKLDVHLLWTDDERRKCSNFIKELEKENEQLKSDLKLALPVLLAIDFKLSINECEAINRLCNAINDDFIKGKDCDVE